MQTVTPVENLSKEYFVPMQERGAKFPALQVNNYRPTANSKIDFVLSESSAELMSEDAILKLKLTPVVCQYDDEMDMFAIASEVRWVILTMPRLFSMDKEDKKIYPIQQGDKLKDLNRVTAARLFLAAIVGEDLILDNDGLPQIFTLKLTSTRTQLIQNNADKTASTIATLNTSLQKHYKASRQWLTHLVSVGLVPFVDKKVSGEDSKKSSLAVDYKFADGALPLSPINQATIHSLIISEDFKAIAADPFGLKLRDESAAFVSEPAFDDGIVF
jgi:hypothetical protein